MIKDVDGRYSYESRRFLVEAVQFFANNWAVQKEVNEFLDTRGGGLYIDKEKNAVATGIGKHRAGRVILKDADYVVRLPDDSLQVMGVESFRMLFKVDLMNGDEVR